MNARNYNVAGSVSLYTSYYLDNSVRRSKEITKCLKRNLDCPAIDKVYLMLEALDEPPLKHDKLNVRHICNRPTYKDFF